MPLVMPPHVTVRAEDAARLTIEVRGVAMTLPPAEWVERAFAPRGPRPRAKLTPPEVADLRERFHTRGEGGGALAARFGLKARNVYLCAWGDTYADVPMPPRLRKSPARERRGLLAAA